MQQKLSFFNWSLKKLLATEKNAFNRAKIKILFTVALLSIIKILVVLIITILYHQQLQFFRAFILSFFYVAALKIILIDKKFVMPVSYALVIIGVFIIISNLYISPQPLNLISFQFLFMMILSSFYLLGTRNGIIFSLIGIIPIIIYLISGHDMTPVYIQPERLASPGYEIVAILNFLTIVLAHTLFQKAFLDNVKEKEILNIQLEKAVEEANLAAKSKTNFLSTMSHELRTPLNAVIGMTNLFLDHPNSTDSEENLKVLKFSATSLHSLINDILDFNKLGSNNVQLEAIPVNLFQLLEDVCSGLRLKAQEKGILLNQDIDPKIKNRFVITDPTRITQIIYNLVGNAIKFTSEGSVTVKIAMSESTECQVHLQFSIKDTGIGINEEKQMAIFEPFHQASSTTTRTYGGTGLGLSIVKQLLTLFNSQIQLKSTLGEGSEFYFELTLPLGDEIKQKVEKENELPIDLSHLKILVAEDNPMNRLVLKKVLARWNNEPVFTENGKEALEKVSHESFDLILMDLHMPEMDGYQATNAIRMLEDPIKSQIPIVAFTASVSHDLDDKLKDVGIDDFIYKPFNPNDLLMKLNQILKHKNNINT